MMQQRNRNLFAGKQKHFQGTSRSGCQVGLDFDADPLLLICFQWPSPRQRCQLMLEGSCVQSCWNTDTLRCGLVKSQSDGQTQMMI